MFDGKCNTDSSNTALGNSNLLFVLSLPVCRRRQNAASFVFCVSLSLYFFRRQSAASLILSLSLQKTKCCFTYSLSLSQSRRQSAASLVLSLFLSPEDKVLLHRVVRQFDPSHFLKPSFSMAGGMFPFSQGQQQAQSRDSFFQGQQQAQSRDSSGSSSNSSNNNRSNEGEQAENGEGRQPESGQGRQPERGQLQSNQGRQPQGGQGGQLPGPGSMFGGQVRKKKL